MLPHALGEVVRERRGRQLTLAETPRHHQLRIGI
jgi:hypothetical protein